MSDKLQQIRNILASHFGLTDENEDGTYLYHLTRSKEAFSYGTMTLDDFIEVDEEFLDEVFEDIKPVIESLLAEKEIYMEKIKELEQENKYYKEQLDISRNMAADIIAGLQKELMKYKNKSNNK
ncbi:hypothetical protein AXJ14_gp135 [Geobacillus virus E3]|uniref:hypothetical protein n=1 Tax=Geobacillus virus E3 TaxID=1572712 RepID=UPI000671A19E|nr:hypothetical protein AXJ14_gp135 [Geobacillus virus E3]AJA41454.1 hypothetical protein E3_0135 [Geobacillus virus E3]